MTSVNVTTTKNTVTVNGETRVVTVKTAGPQGAQGVLQSGDLGDITVTTTGSGTQSVAINTDAITSAKIANAAVTTNEIQNLTIINNDISNSAAIAGTKISPSFGDQDITTGGNLNVNGGQIYLSGSTAALVFNDNEDDPDYRLVNSNGVFKVRDGTNGADRIKVNTDGHVDITSNLDCLSGLDVTGDITVSGTVGSVDLSTYQADGGSYLRSDADDSFTGTLTGVSDTVNPVIQINGSGPNIIRFDRNTGDTSDSIDLIYRTTPNTLAFERVSDSQIMFSVDADDQQAIFNGNVDCNAGLDVTNGDITGTLGSGVTGTTQSATDDSTKIATTAFVKTAVANLVDSSPDALNTLAELAAAINEDASFSSTVNQNIATKLAKTGGTLTGELVISTNAPLIKFEESVTNKNYFLVLDDSHLSIRKDSTAGSNIVQRWNSDGHVDFLTNVDFASGIDVTGQIVSESTTGTGSTGLKIANSNESFVQYFEGGGADATFVMSYTGSGGTDIRFKHNGEIQLNNAGQEKLKTTSTGVDVTGNIEVSGSGTFDSGLTVKDASGSDPSMQINHSDADVTGEFLRIGRTDLGTRYHSLKAKHGGAATANLLSFNLHNGSTATSQTEVLKLNGDGSVDFAGNLTLPDNGKIILGDGGETDSFISFNGTNLLIKETEPTGSLRLTGHNVFLTNPSQNDETYLKCNGQSTDRNVELYCQGTQRLETTSTGIEVTGVITGTNHLDLPDDATLKLGDNDEFQIFHRGNDSVSLINEQGGGYLSFGSNGSRIEMYDIANARTMAKFNVGGSCEFNHGATTRLETSSTGISVTGEITGTSHLDLPSDARLNLGDNNEFFIFHQSSNGNSIIKENGGGSLSIQTNGASITFYDTANNRSMALFNTGGACVFKHAADIRLQTTSTGVGVTGGITWSAQSNVTGTIDFAADTLATYTPSQTGSGTDTGTDVAISLRRGHKIVSQHDGFFRTLLTQQTNHDIHIGQNNTGIVRHIDLLPGNTGSVRLFYNGGTNSTPILNTTATGATINGELEIASAGGLSSSPSLYVNNSSSRTFINSGQLLTPNITAGQQNILVIGKARATKQAAFIGYKYSSANSNELDNNLLTFNHWGANELVTINGQGDVVATGDGTFDDIRIGEHAGNNDFGGIFHKNQSGSEYMMISKDEHTFISASSGHGVSIVGGNNVFANNIQVHPTNGINLTAANNVNILDGNIDFSSNADSNPVIIMKADNNRVKYRVFTNSDFGMGFSGNITHGGLNGFCMTFQVSDTANRGWLFLNSGQSLDKGAMALTSDGKMNVAHSLRLGYGESDTTESGATHALDVSGSAIISSSLTAGGLTFPTVNGNDGQVLTSDGAGNVQWEDSTGTFNGGTIQNELILDPSDSTHPKLRFIPASTSQRHFFFELDGSGLKLMTQPADGSSNTFLWNFQETENEVYQSIMHRKTADFTFSNVYPHINAKNAHNRNKINLYAGFNFQIGTENVTYGGLNSSAITFSCTNNDSSGFIFTSPGHGSDDGAMAITANGKVTIAHSLRLGYGTDNDTTTPGATHALDVSGSISSTSTISATTSNASSSNNIRKITTSTSQPSGGADGDIWIVVPS